MVAPTAPLKSTPCLTAPSPVPAATVNPYTAEAGTTAVTAARMRKAAVSARKAPADSAAAALRTRPGAGTTGADEALTTPQASTR